MAWQPEPPPSWAMPLAEKLGEALRMIAEHRGYIECDMSYEDVERAFFTILAGLAAGNVHLSCDDRQEIVTRLVNGQGRATVKDALKAVKGSAASSAPGGTATAR